MHALCPCPNLALLHLGACHPPPCASDIRNQPEPAQTGRSVPLTASSLRNQKYSAAYIHPTMLTAALTVCAPGVRTTTVPASRAARLIRPLSSERSPR